MTDLCSVLVSAASEQRGTCFVVPTAMTVHNSLFLFMTSCSVPGGYQCLGGTCCFHPRGNNEYKGSVFLLNVGKYLSDHKTGITRKITIRTLLSSVVKVKVKFTLEQTTKAQRWRRGIALLFL